VSVSLSRGFTWLRCAKMAERIDVLLGVETLVDLRNIVLDESPDFNFSFGFDAAFAKLLCKSCLRWCARTDVYTDVYVIWLCVQTNFSSVFVEVMRTHSSARFSEKHFVFNVESSPGVIGQILVRLPGAHFRPHRIHGMQTIVVDDPGVCQGGGLGTDQHRLWCGTNSRDPRNSVLDV